MKVLRQKRASVSRHRKEVGTGRCVSSRQSFELWLGRPGGIISCWRGWGNERSEDFQSIARRGALRLREQLAVIRPHESDFQLLADSSFSKACGIDE